MQLVAEIVPVLEEEKYRDATVTSGHSVRENSHGNTDENTAGSSIKAVNKNPLLQGIPFVLQIFRRGKMAPTVVKIFTNMPNKCRNRLN